MNYIVMDLEWNQSPLGKEYENKKLPFEIIEIGAVKLNDNLEEIDRFHALIKPKVYMELHHMTKQIVSLSMKDLLSNGESFERAAGRFLQWCDKDYIFCTWGNMDLMELQRNMDYYNLPTVYHAPVEFYDLQKLFSLLYEDGKLRRQLQYAVDYLGLKSKLQYHSALNDAIYTAFVMEHIDFNKIKKNYSIDCYHIPTNKKEEIYAVFDDYDKYISIGYDTKEELMNDKDVLALTCHECNKKCRKKIRWFSTNNRIYHCLGICRQHGFIKGKIRVRQAENGLYFAIKTMKPVNDEGANKVYEKQAQLREKRRAKRLKMALKRE